MQEKGLRVAKTDRTFFSSITTTISKLLIPTRIGINGMLISLKRNNLLKAFEQYNLKANSDPEKESAMQEKYENMYSLYLESIDKFIMDSIYKKVKNRTATRFEEEALSKYYTITHLKETQYLEYKNRKQKYLLELDYETIKSDNKEKLLNRYKEFYIDKMDSLYKSILKNYSIQIADKLSSSYNDKEEIYEKIFSTLEEYIREILPIKIELGREEKLQEIYEEYDKFTELAVGKLDKKDYIEKRMVLLGISRKLFTHSLPLVVAEQCYIKLLKETRALIVESKNSQKQELAYKMLIKLIEDYNVKLLTTKIYWEDIKQRDNYKKFWDKYKKITESEDDDIETKKEILFIKEDMKALKKCKGKYKEIIKYYKEKLASFRKTKIMKINFEKLKEFKFTRKKETV